MPRFHKALGNSKPNREPVVDFVCVDVKSRPNKRGEHYILTRLIFY